MPFGHQRWPGLGEPPVPPNPPPDRAGIPKTGGYLLDWIPEVPMIPTTGEQLSPGTTDRARAIPPRADVVPAFQRCDFPGCTRPGAAAAELCAPCVRAAGVILR